MHSREFDFSHLNTPLSPDKEEKEFDFSHLLTENREKTQNIEDVIKQPKEYAKNLILGSSPYEQLKPTLEKIPHALSTISADIKNVGSKLPGMAVKGIGNIPKDIDYLKETLPKAGKLIYENPKLAGKYGIAGAGELSGQISRLPQSLVDYLAHIGMIKPETAKEFPRSYSEKEVKELMDKFVGESRPGGELIRGTIRDIPTIYGVGKIASTLNPFKYTVKNIAKDVMETRGNQKLIHETEYNKVFDKAEKQGFNKVYFDKNKIDLETIKENSTDKYYGALEKLINDPILKNAQKSQSDLGKLINGRSLNKDILTSPEQATKKAAIEARDYIKDKMFRDQSGKINLPLKKRYDFITKSYEKNVIPYTTNKAINEFKKGDLLPEELIPKLSRGKFAARKGKSHPEISRRKYVKPVLKALGAVSGAHLLGWDRPLIDKLLGKE